MEYYKVVFEQDDGRLTSMVSNEVLTYKIGRRTTPRFGPIFAFDSLEAAEKLRDSMCYSYALRILRGPGAKSRLRRKHVLYPAVKTKVMKKFWSGRLNPNSESIHVPVGTVMLEWFEPEEEVTT